MSIRERIAALLDPRPRHPDLSGRLKGYEAIIEQAKESLADKNQFIDSMRATVDSLTKANAEHKAAADDWAAKAAELQSDLLAARGASFLGRRDEEVASAEVELAVSAMASLDQWKSFVGGFMDRREQWVADTRQPVVYQNHAELASVNARIAECDHWLSIFEEVSRKVHGPTDDTP
jgi:hypothetical protein